MSFESRGGGAFSMSCVMRVSASLASRMAAMVLLGQLLGAWGRRGWRSAGRGAASTASPDASACSMPRSGGDGRRANRFLLCLLVSYSPLARPVCGAPTPQDAIQQELSTGWVAKVAIRSATSARTRLQRHPRRRCVGTALPERGTGASARDAHRIKNEAFPHAPRAAVGEHGVAAARRRQLEPVWRRPKQ